MAKLQSRPSHLPPRPNPMEGIYLPVEILEQIVRHVPDKDQSVALPASHKITKTLFSCLNVCKAVTGISTELLHQRCLYIDSSWRLRAVVRSYASSTPMDGKSVDPTITRRNASTSLFLKPFSSDTIDEPSLVASVSQLFELLSTTLRRLIIDMPLRSYYPDEPGGPSLRSDLRAAFLNLKAIEEFTSVRDELYLSTILPGNHTLEPRVWANWPNLRRLALYNVDISDDLGPVLNSMPSLKTLILTRPDREEDLEESKRSWNAALHVGIVNTHRDFSERNRWQMKQGGTAGMEHFGSATAHRTYSTLPSEGFRPLPVVGMRMNECKYFVVLKLTKFEDIICVDGQKPVPSRGNEHVKNSATRRAAKSNNWAAYDLRNTFNDIRECQEWVKENALKDTLWPKSNPKWPPRLGEPVIKACSQ